MNKHVIKHSNMRKAIVNRRDMLQAHRKTPCMFSTHSSEMTRPVSTLFRVLPNVRGLTAASNLRGTCQLGTIESSPLTIRITRLFTHAILSLALLKWSLYGFWAETLNFLRHSWTRHSIQLKKDSLGIKMTIFRWLNRAAIVSTSQFQPLSNSTSKVNWTKTKNELLSFHE